MQAGIEACMQAEIEAWRLKNVADAKLAKAAYRATLTCLGNTPLMYPCKHSKYINQQWLRRLGFLFAVDCRCGPLPLQCVTYSKRLKGATFGCC